MLHFSCDICGKDLTSEGTTRYVIKMEGFAATDPAELTAEDMDADHVEEMARLLNAIEDGEITPDVVPSHQKHRFDLCMVCYGKFSKDPLGRDSMARLYFSEN